MYHGNREIKFAKRRGTQFPGLGRITDGAGTSHKLDLCLLFISVNLENMKK